MVIYLHGFNSAFDPDNVKVRALAQVYQLHPLTYDSFAPFDEVMEFLTTQADSLGAAGLKVVGTSLGGFFAAHLASRLGLPAVVINPCYDPHAMLDKYVGQEFPNFKTGVVRTLTPATGRSYAGRSVANLGFQQAPLVLLDAADELLDSAATARELGHFPVHVFPGGSHRFEHIEAALPVIDVYFSRCAANGG
jgi:predicted esterase YcpF (UPF0227 family)